MSLNTHYNILWIRIKDNFFEQLLSQNSARTSMSSLITSTYSWITLSLSGTRFELFKWRPSKKTLEDRLANTDSNDSDIKESLNYFGWTEQLTELKILKVPFREFSKA